MQIHKRNHLNNEEKYKEMTQIDIKCQNQKNTKKNKLSMRNQMKCSILFKNKNHTNSMKKTHTLHFL